MNFTLNGYLVLGAIAVCICAFYLVKAGGKLCFVRKLEQMFETVGAEDRQVVFQKGKKQFCFVGELLKTAFGKGIRKELFEQYTDLYKAYVEAEKDEYQTFCHGKASLADFDEEAVCSMVAIVMMSAEHTGAHDDSLEEQIEFYKGRVKAKVECVETIAAQPQILGVQPEKRLGSKENPILVAGEKGIKMYFDSLVAEDGTHLKHVHKGTLYIRNEKLGIVYDLKKYSLRDAENDVEVCQLWLNAYGTETCKTPIDGFVSKEDVLAGKIQLAQTELKAAEGVLAIPDVTVGNDVSTGKPQVSWSAVEGADKYFVYRSRKKDSDFVYHGASVDMSYIDVNVVPGATYYYKVVAADTANRYGRSEQSDACSVVCVLPAPVVTVGSEEETGRVRLTWDAVEGALRYVIYRSTSEDGEYMRMYRQKGTTYVNVAYIEPHVQYFYKVRAVHTNDAANSPFSAIVTGSWEPPVEEAE